MSVGIKEVLRFEIGSCRRSAEADAESLISNLQQYLSRLKAGDVPVTCPGAHSLLMIWDNHRRLRVLIETLEQAEKADKL